MRKIFLLICIFGSVLTGKAQKDQHTVTFDGMGVFRLGMNKAELEKLLKTKIVLKHIGVEEVYSETVKVMYMGSEYELDLMRNDNVVAHLDGISTTNPSYKTAEGIGIGSDHVTIINTYEKHLLMITRDMITYTDIDNLHASIVFSMQNNKVTKIKIEPTAAFLDRE